MNVELVHVETSDGVRLDGVWRKPDAPGKSRFPVDAMILHHGVAENFYGSSPHDSFAPWLVENGCAAIRVNNRGHDPVSQVGEFPKYVKIGAAYEIIDDCRYDWRAWIDFAEEAGYKRIGIWGHSLGAVKSIYYAATENDPRVQCVLAASPPRFSYSHYAGASEWEGVKDIGRLFAETCSVAQAHIDDGRPRRIMEVDYPVPLLISAATYVDKYGPAEAYDIVKRIPEVKAPLFLFIGATEPHGEFPFLGLPEEMQKLAAELDHFTFEYIEGADHFYTKHRKEVWGAASQWLKSLDPSGL